MAQYPVLIHWPGDISIRCHRFWVWFNTLKSMISDCLGPPGLFIKAFHFITQCIMALGCQTTYGNISSPLPRLLSLFLLPSNVFYTPRFGCLVGNFFIKRFFSHLLPACCTSIANIFSRINTHIHILMLYLHLMLTFKIKFYHLVCFNHCCSIWSSWSTLQFMYLYELW